YILENMDKSTNTMIITTRELAIKSKTSRQTVIETLKILEEAQIIARKTGAIMIHSSLIHRGNESKEKYLLARFQEWETMRGLIYNVMYLLPNKTRKQKNLFLLSSRSNPRTHQTETDLIARRSISNSTRIINISYVSFIALMKLIKITTFNCI